MENTHPVRENIEPTPITNFFPNLCAIHPLTNEPEQSASQKTVITYPIVIVSPIKLVKLPKNKD